MIRIGCPQIEIKEGKTYLKAFIKNDEENVNEWLWYATDEEYGKYFCYETSDAFVVPYHLSTGRKTLRMLKLWAKGQITIPDFFHMVRGQTYSTDENRVIDLVEQTPLSTSEIIRCFERNLTDVSTAEKVITGIYGDEDSEQSRIANEEFNAIQKRAVLQAVSNLYLKRKVLLELA